jgi:hypothetical protein
MHRFGGLAVAALLGLGVTTSGAATPVRSSAPVRAWVTDGNVMAIASTPTGLYAGGDFTLIGPATGAWVDVRASGVVGRIPAAVGGSVSDAVTDGSGGWFLKGAITTVGGVARSGITHLRADGKLDPGWRLRVSGTTNALARAGTTLYLGGSFSQVNGVARTNLAAVDLLTGKVLPWNPSATGKKRSDDAWVDDMAVGQHGDAVYVAGFFQRISGKTRSNAAAITTAGKATPWEPRPNDEVTVVAPDPLGGAVYLAGSFDRVGGENRAGLAAVGASKGSVMRWNPDCDGDVSVIAVAPKGTPIYVGGEFASLGGKSRRGLGAVDDRSGLATPWDPGVGGAVHAELLDNPKGLLYFGGEFDSVGDQDRSNLAAVETRTGRPSAWNREPSARSTCSHRTAAGGSPSAASFGRSARSPGPAWRCSRPTGAPLTTGSRRSRGPFVRLHPIPAAPTSTSVAASRSATAGRNRASQLQTPRQKPSPPGAQP